MKKLIFILLIGTLFLTNCSNNNISDKEPTRVVTSYFESWNIKDYQSMYNSISDGFKSIEPTATRFNNFKEYAEAQSINSVEIISIKQTSNDGIKSMVDYEVIFISNKKQIPFKDTFTLKYKSQDKIPGWKLIHPYGDNIDAS